MGEGSRQRAREQNRAAESGRSAVQVVERIVRIPGRHARHEEWVALLKELADQVRSGVVDDRDLQSTGEATVAVNNALAERLSAARP